MTFLTFAIKSAWRKPVRTLLMIVCIATTFMIYGLTASFVNGSQSANGSSEDILGVMNAAGIGQPMPRAYVNRIEGEDGVAAVAYSSRVRGFVTTEQNTVMLSVTQPRQLMAVNGEDLGLTDELLVNLEQSRDSVLVGRALAQAKGWETGQVINFTSFAPLSADGGRNLQLRVAGIFYGANAQTDTYFILGQYDYVNALRARNKDTADVFIVKPDDGVKSSELAVQLDDLFSNSNTPTQTQSEKQFLEAFLRQYADVGLIVQLVVTASFVTLLMIVVNTMVLAIRERYFEIGVLKTLGFPRKKIMALIMSETLFVFLVGGSIGLCLAFVTAKFAGASLGLVLSYDILLKSVGFIIGMALIAGVLPTLNAIRIPVVAAFRTR
ncbi:MAG: FtsX-like permease family protein [Paracoccaceae bacterium]